MTATYVPFGRFVTLVMVLTPFLAFKKTDGTTCSEDSIDEFQWLLWRNRLRRSERLVAQTTRCCVSNSRMSKRRQSPRSRPSLIL